MKRLQFIALPFIFFLVFTKVSVGQNYSTYKYPFENKINLSGLDSSYQELFAKNYLREVLAGKRDAFFWHDNTKKMTVDQLIKYSKGPDTVYIESPEPPYNVEMKIMAHDKEPLEAITDVLYREYWTIDEKGIIHKKTVGIAFFIDFKPLCLIKLNDEAW